MYRTSGSRGPAATVPMTPEFCALDLPVMQHVLSSLGVPLRGGTSQVSLVNVYHQPVAYQFASVSSYLDGAGVVKVNLHESGWHSPGRPSVLPGLVRAGAVHGQPDLTGDTGSATTDDPPGGGAERSDGPGLGPAQTFGRHGSSARWWTCTESRRRA